MGSTVSILMERFDADWPITAQRQDLSATAQMHLPYLSFPHFARSL